MKAAPAVQQSLVDLAELDQRLAGLAHRRAHLPEQLELDRLNRERIAAAESAARAGIAVEDVDRAVKKLTGDIDAVRRRLDRDREALQVGELPARQLTELEHELGTLTRRQAALEDERAELVARRDALQADVQHSGATVSDLDGRIGEATRLRNIARSDLDDSTHAARLERERVAESVPAALMDVYRRLTDRGAVGAGELAGGRCTACSMSLDRDFVARAASAEPDDVLTCPECEAILAHGAKRR